MTCHDPQTFANPECLTCWAGTFGAWVTANRRHAGQPTTILLALIARGLDVDVAEHIRGGWDSEFSEILDGLPDDHIAALNNALAVNDSRGAAEATPLHAALSASLAEADSSASLLPCSYCGAVTDQPCRETCQGRYRR